MLIAIAVSFIFLIWLIFDRLRLLRLSLPIALALGAVAPVGASVLLFGVAQYHPVSSNLMVMRRVIEVRPLVSTPGRVVEIVVKPNERLKKDQTLFRIDREPYESEVRRLHAAVAGAEQNVQQLAAAVMRAASNVQSAQARQSLAQSEYDRQFELFRKKVISEATLERFNTALETSKETLKEAQIVEESARLAYNSTINGVNTTVAQVREQLRQAEVNLSDATVKAPCDGFVTNMQLLSGAVVSSAGAVMTFVCDDNVNGDTVVLASLPEGSYRNVNVGDYAEVIFKMYPGHVFSARVQHTIDVTNEGQLRISGLVPDLKVTGPTRFGILISVDNAETIRLPAGAQGSAAILTGRMQLAGVFRMALMRSQSYLNYIF